MKKGKKFDLGFILVLGIVLILICLLNVDKIPISFLYIPFLMVYYIGRYMTLVAARVKE